MSNNVSVSRRAFPMPRTLRVAALVVLASVGAIVPTSVAGAGLDAPAGACSPVAGSDAYSTDQDVSLSVGAPGVKANDTDCGLNPLVTGTTAHGSLTLNADGSFEYTPDPGFFGFDQFVYAYPLGPPVDQFGRGPVTEGRRPHGGPEHGHVGIDVIAAPVPTDPPCSPVAIDDAYATPQDVVLNVALPGVTVNDTDCDFFVHLFSNPTNGTLMLNADGTFQYTPNAGFSGIDSFEYALAEIMPGFAAGPQRGVSGWRAPQGADDNVATVTITVSGAPPTTTSTTTTSTTPPTTTTLPAPTTTVPASGILPATR